MAIAFDAATAGNYASGTSYSFSHTCSGTDRILFVHAFKNGTADTITGVTYNGVSMTLINKQVASTDRYTYLYYLIAPATGSNTITISSSSSVAIGGNASSYTGVDQTSPIDTQTTTTFTASPCTTSVTTTTDNCWAILTTIIGTTVEPVASTNSTKRARNTTFADAVIFDNNTAITPAGSYSMTVTESTFSTEVLGVNMAAFKPSVSGGSTFAPRMSLLGVGR